MITGISQYRGLNNCLYFFGGVLVHIHIYIYIYIEREREIER